MICFSQLRNKITKSLSLLFLFVCLLRKQHRKEGLKASDVRNNFSESGLVPLVRFLPEQKTITVCVRLALQDSMTVKTVFPDSPTTARKSGGLAAVMVKELDTWSEGARVGPPH